MRGHKREIGRGTSSRRSRSKASEGMRIVERREIRREDPVGKRSAKRVRGDEGVPERVVSIKVTEDESGPRRRKDGRVKASGARVKRRGADRRRIDVKEGENRTVEMKIDQKKIGVRVRREGRRR